MPDLFRRADMAVLMSGWEAMPCALLEAMASSRTAIATDIPAPRELLLEGETGFMYPVGDVERLAGILVDLAADAELRERRQRSPSRRRATRRRGLYRSL